MSFSAAARRQISQLRLDYEWMGSSEQDPKGEWRCRVWWHDDPRTYGQMPTKEGARKQARLAWSIYCDYWSEGAQTFIRENKLSPGTKPIKLDEREWEAVHEL